MMVKYRKCVYGLNFKLNANLNLEYIHVKYFFFIFELVYHKMIVGKSTFCKVISKAQKGSAK